MEKIFKTILKKIILIGIYFKANVEKKFKFVVILLLAITINSCFMLEETEDNENSIATRTADMKGAFLLAGQSNMEGHVPSDLYNNIINLTTNENGSSLVTKLKTIIKDWYINYDNGYAMYAYSDTVNALEAQELLRLKNDGLVGDFLKRARSDVWCSFNSNGVSGLKEGFGYPIGPELTMGHYLGNKENSSISLIKVAHGGTTLYDDWLSPTAASRLGKPIGPLYTELKNRIKSIKSNPNSVNPDYSAGWKGFVWFQGENDCFNQINAQKYEANLRDLNKDVRNEIGDSKLPVVIVELNYWAQTLSYGNVVTAAQNAVAANDSNIELIKINDLSQFFHMDPATQLIIGERIGKSMEKLLSLNQSDPGPDPDPDPDPGGKYKLRVKRGSGSGLYSANEDVEITAKKPSSFKKWKVVRGNANIKDINSSSTTFKMPSENVVIKAVYSKSRVGCGSLFKQQVDDDEDEYEDIDE